MRNIHIVVDDDEYEALEKIKDGLTWHDFILKLTKIKNIKNGK